VRPIPTPTTTGTRGMVAAGFPAASEAGREILAAGGNAVDAAVAAAWALSVCEPSGSGLGGHSVALIRTGDGRTVLLDGHARAPGGVSRRTVTRAQQHTGHRACTVPTTPAVLACAQERYGVLRPEAVLEPAIRLASEGYAITRLQRRQLGWCRDALAATPTGGGFLGPPGEVPVLGSVFRQPGLAAALERMASAGVGDFYAGEIARAIVADMRRHGGLLDAADLAAAAKAVERAPVAAGHGPDTVLTAGRPGGGLELLLALGVLARLGPPADELSRWYAHLAHATYLAFAERERASAPDAGEEDVAAILSGERAEALLDQARSHERLEVGGRWEEPGETTHVCAADADGTVVSLSQSIQSLFGAKVAHERYGFLYNNSLVTCPRRPHRHRLGSGATARSNLAPTLVLDAGGRPVLTLGAAGSRRIVSSLLHVLSGVRDRGLGLGEAVAMPRVHARLRGPAWVERDVPTGELAAAGFAVRAKPRRSFSMGAVQAIALGADGTLIGACDPRREGEPRGL